MKRNGFTLIELVITIVIIFLLVGICIPIFKNLQKRSIIGTATHNLKNIQFALQAHQAKSDVACYPKTDVITSYSSLKNFVKNNGVDLPENPSGLKWEEFLYYISNTCDTYEIAVNVITSKNIKLHTSPSYICCNDGTVIGRECRKLAGNLPTCE